MQGFLVITTSDNTQTSFELPKESVNLSYDSNGFQLSRAETIIAGSIAFLSWDKASCSWLFQPGNSELEYFRSGRAMSQSKIRLSKNDAITVGGRFSLTYTSMLSEPLWDGAPSESIDISKQTAVVIGRLVPGGEAEVGKISLDGDNFLISKKHAILEKNAEGWSLEDYSKMGTELNGKLIINKVQLVYGDRFTISDYIFEFNGSHIKRIDHHVNGSLSAKNLSVIVKDRQTGKPLKILNNVSTEIKQGEFIGILGGSGQGKSTFLDAMCGMSPATEGSVHIGGVPNQELAKKYPGTIGYVPQDDIVHKELSVYAAFLYNGKLRLKLPADQLASLIDRTLETLSLTEHRGKQIKTLSGGQRKRVSIGIELLSKPAILFLDEPSSGLDPATEQDLMELLQSLSLNNLTVICTTHVLQNAYIFNRLFFIHSGRLIFTGNTDESREFFSDSDHSRQDSHGRRNQSHSQSSPLEKIYSTILSEVKSAEEWETKFKAETSSQLTLEGSQDSKPIKKKQPGSGSKLITLLKRQWSIMRSDWLNLAFLFAQVIVIGLLTAWTSSDLGFRTFIGLIAAMWFGCSNGAQQIISELPILQRERVCGLGLNVYVMSKVIFQSTISIAQAVVLFAVITFGGLLFHPNSLDAEAFSEDLIERENPYIMDNSKEVSVDDFMPIGDLEDGEGGLADMPDTEDESDDEIVEEAAKKEVKYSGMVAWLAQSFYLKENILESGKLGLTRSDGEVIMGDDKIQRSTSGISISRVLSVTMSLRIGAFLLASFVGVCLGLAVSALVRSPTQAVMWVPLLLIPQILLGGFVISIPEMDPVVRKVASFVPSNASQRIVDVSHIYGRATPSLSNQTKTPLFLTSDGKKEMVTWETRRGVSTQDYQKISNVNTSWQNLTVVNDLLGHHKQNYNVAFGTDIQIVSDTVEQRNDVKYMKGTSYLNLQPAYAALLILLAWIVLCYGTIIIGLWKKKS